MQNWRSGKTGGKFIRRLKMNKGKSLLALIGTVVLLLSLAIPLAQCAPAAEEEVTPPEEWEIKYGGRLNVGFTYGMTDTAIDMKLDWTSWGCLYKNLVYDNLALFGLNPDTYSFHPSLVQSYEVSEDGKTWTLHLVENATWHDGVPFTAEDVAFTFEYLHNKTPGWGAHDKDWEEIEVIDDYTVKAVNAIGLSTVTHPGWWLWDPVIPKHIFEPYKDDILSFQNEESLGTGAFKLKEFKEGQYMWLVANEDYWGGRPYVDEVVFIMYPSAEAALMAMRSGEADCFGGNFVSALNIDVLEADPDIYVEVAKDMKITYLAFNLHKDTPLQDKDVRHAIAYGIDCDRVIDMVYVGYAERSDGWIYNESQMHNPDLPQYDYNPDKANEILDGAGYLDTDGDGIRNDPTTGENLVFDLSAPSSNSDYVKTCTLIHEMLPAIGIDTVVTIMEADAYSEFLYNPASDKLEMMVAGDSPSPDPWSDWVWVYNVGWGAGGEEYNPTYWSNPRFNQLWVDMSCAKTVEEKKAILYEMQDIMAEELPMYFLARQGHIAPWRTDKLEGWVNTIGGPVSWVNSYSIMNVHLK